MDFALLTLLSKIKALWEKKYSNTGTVALLSEMVLNDKGFAAYESGYTRHWDGE